MALDIETAILSYLSRDEAVEREFQSLTTIYERGASPIGWGRIHSSDPEFDTEEDPDWRKNLTRLLDEMVDDGLLERRKSLADFEPSYRASDLGFYNAVIGSDAIVVDEVSKSKAVDSSTWTGIPKHGMLSDAAISKLRIALEVASNALEKSGSNNHEKAQARAYIIALHALAEAPAPPADLIWNIVLRLGSLAGTASLFVALFQLYK